jgi:C4-dicarboxylate transporter DctM subunit
MTTLIIFGAFLLPMVLGIPIALSLVIGAVIPMFSIVDIPLMQIPQKFYNAINMYALMAVPFFVISGGLLDKGGVSKRLVNFANSLVGWLPGGLAVVTFLACAFFGAISGVSSATVVAIGSIMVPAMIREGYSKPFALTTVAAGGWLGIVVPPSTPMVLYGISTNTSIGDLFMGGFIPGFLLAGGMALYAIIYGKKNLPPPSKFSIKQVWKSFREAILAIIMPIIVLGGIYTGVFTPTESAAVAVLYGFIVGCFIYKELDLKIIYSIFRSATITSAVVMFIIGGASIFGYVMTRAQVPMQITNFILSVAHNKVTFMLMVTVLLLIVGTFMETTPAILILAPILSPLLGNYNIDPVYFGVIMIINLGIGMLTPPVGMNLYVSAGLINEKVDTVINKHLLYYILAAAAVLVLLMAVPEIILFLPSHAA